MLVARKIKGRGGVCVGNTVITRTGVDIDLTGGEGSCSDDDFIITGASGDVDVFTSIRLTVDVEQMLVVAEPAASVAASSPTSMSASKPAAKPQRTRCRQSG